MESGASEIGDIRRFALHFLDVVFAEFAKAEGVGFTNGFGTEDFGDGEKAYGRRLAMSARAGVGDAGLDGVQAVGEGVRQVPMIVEGWGAFGRLKLYFLDGHP